MTNYMKNKDYQITGTEKDFAIQHLTGTANKFIETIKDLTEDQWYFRAASGQWSIAECADHLLQTELYFFKPTIDKMLSEPANPEKRKEAEGKDVASYAGMEDRSYKIKGQPWEEVFEKKIDKENLIKSFLEKRSEMMEWIKNTDEELRVHFTYFPGLETIDIYQLILFVSGHTTRHTLQIVESMQSELYPGK